MRKYFSLLLLSFLLLACGKHNYPKSPVVNLILDTDMGPDYDDLGAMTVMYALADSGQVNVLATLSSNKDEQVIPCIEVINSYFNRPDMPVGAPKQDAPSLTSWHKKDKWTEHLPAKFKHKTPKTSDAPDAVQVYRQILSQQPDTSVTICTIGFFSNLRYLLDSQPDQYSPLNGVELVKQKVKLLVSMAAEFPSGKGEFNVKCDAPAAKKVVEEWPGKIIFSGFEIGKDILTGKEVAQMDVTDSPVKDAYQMNLAQDNPEGRNSWDQTAVLVAIKGYEPYYKIKSGTIIIDGTTGANQWTDDPAGKHAYLIKDMPEAKVTAILENYMKHQPLKK